MDSPERPSGKPPTPPSSGPPPTPAGTWTRLLLIVAAVMLVNAVLVSRLDPAISRVKIPYSPTFLEQVAKKNVVTVSSKGDTLEGTLRKAIKYPADAKVAVTRFKTEIPGYADTDQLEQRLSDSGAVLEAEPSSTGGSSIVATLLFSLLPILIIGWLLFSVGRRGGAGGLGGVGKSKARRVEPSMQHVSFKDVAGIDEVKEELAQIVDFLKEPERYRKLGARIPHGVLLTGPPGTGKTLLARALAGEAQVPFFEVSASEFVEMFVGVGASRVRDLFAQAKKEAPAIVFIDELDAVGRSRSGIVSGSGSNDEREQTLNQILTELDGFDATLGVIVLAATNRPEILDRALLRPGRFDRRVAVQPPDTAGRRAILAVHTRSVPLAKDVDLDRIAASTTGMVGADLSNLVNEAALLAAGHERHAVTMADLMGALERMLLGAERRIVLSDEERRRTAYHESGHALIGMLLPEADPVRKVSIIPRGEALGVTLAAPSADRFSIDRAELHAKLRVILGGRVAEELVMDDISTGAESDLVQLSELVHAMVTRWGMSERLGPLALELPQSGPWATAIQAPLSPELQHEIEQEMHRLAEEAHADTVRLLTEHRAGLDGLAEALLVHETLDGPDAYRAAGIEPPPEPQRRAQTVAPVAAPSTAPVDRAEH
jgi:cell division protease FtsH